MNLLKNALALLAAAYLLSGCAASSRIALTDPVWNNNAGYAVEGRTQTVLQKKPLRFGEFYTTNVHTSWTKSGTYASGVSARRRVYDYSQSSRNFTLANGRNKQIQVYTYTRFSSYRPAKDQAGDSNIFWMMDMLGLNGIGKTTYCAQVFEPGAQKPWELVLDMEAAGLNPKNYAGYFALSNEDYYVLRPVNKVMGKNGPVGLPVGVLGYEITTPSGKPVAAVSVLNKGVVYMADIPESERFLMAGLCSALLLYEEN